MFPSFLLSLREGLEAALIIGIVLGALRKMNRSHLNPLVWSGAISAGTISLFAAVLMYRFGATLEGPAEQVFEGITMLLAASVLTWMIFWMQRQARSLRSDLESDVRRAALRSGRNALFSLAFLAVLREGVELALFLTAAAMTAGGQATFFGAVLGLAGSALLGWLLFASTVRLNLSRFFLVTSALLILFAGGLVAHGVHELNEVGWIPAVIEHVWDFNPVLPESSALGLFLKAIFGYNGNPSLTEVLSYLGYFLAILIGLRWSSSRLPVEQKA